MTSGIPSGARPFGIECRSRAELGARFGDAVMGFSKLLKITFFYALLTPAFLSATNSPAAIVAQPVSVPEEYEIAGGPSLAFANSGSVAYSGAGSLKLNPGMLALEKQYNVAGGYHWPAFGREFYKLGVVDSKSSPIAAGVSYTSLMEADDSTFGGEQPVSGRYVTRRIGLGAAYAFHTLSIGVAGQWTEAGPLGSGVEVDTKAEDAVRGTSLNVGAVGLLTPTLRLGASVEGLANKSVNSNAPRYLRVGLASLLSQGQTSLHLDWQRRETLQSEVASEQMLTGSFSVKVYDYLRLLGGYGKDPQSGHLRETAAAGIALVGPKVSFSYTASRPDLRFEESHQSINMNLELSM